VFALALLVVSAASLPFLLLNLNVAAEGYPPAWQLVLASLDAGVQEEIFSRLFLMTLLAWLGGLVRRGEDGRPSRGVVWTAIILSGLTFGWGHVDDQIYGAEIAGALAAVMLVNTALGVTFGWLYWKQGLESAILAHFLVDAVGSAVVIPAYMSGSLLLGLLVLAGLMLAAVLSWRLLVCKRARDTTPAT
jgi:membrane protease YdiL (CAAX protease family)